MLGADMEEEFSALVYMGGDLSHPSNSPSF